MNNVFKKSIKNFTFFFEVNYKFVIREKLNKFTIKQSFYQ